MTVNNEHPRASGDQDDRLWTIGEAAQFLGLQKSSMYHLISQGRVPVIRISSRCVRFSRRALLEWVKEHSSGGGCLGRSQAR